MTVVTVIVMPLDTIAVVVVISVEMVVLVVRYLTDELSDVGGCVELIIGSDDIGLLLMVMVDIGVGVGVGVGVGAGVGVGVVDSGVVVKEIVSEVFEKDIVEEIAVILGSLEVVVVVGIIVEEGNTSDERLVDGWACSEVEDRKVDEIGISDVREEEATVIDEEIVGVGSENVLLLLLLLLTLELLLLLVDVGVKEEVGITDSESVDEGAGEFEDEVAVIVPAVVEIVDSLASGVVEEVVIGSREEEEGVERLTLSVVEETIVDGVFDCSVMRIDSDVVGTCSVALVADMVLLVVGNRLSIVDEAVVAVVGEGVGEKEDGSVPVKLVAEAGTLQTKSRKKE
ncbi:hypothetical protein BDF20DRAFT_435811 [Mycotypha africana]|uniref:uncharacterized protein n=1 Tax=Mycotypha africana TaxID=64632 RepID=UPI00230155B1|nr:uncharacterized protein BDF20DRAFT_435811 [Mycotypha africana]KAI8981916.1 hypothetical protein BDF20DRAFT_435811 [Mycotypha africana]